jgi:catechol 2,3-dioxygenase-like lactoylglutathione lyase family enzyme
MTLKVKAIDFVVVNVADMERSRAFYRDTLGMDFPVWEESANWQEIQSPPTAMALRVDRRNPGANAAIALAVDDVAAAVEELRAKGVRVLIEPGESDTCWTAMIQDPDGNLLLLHRRKDGTAG